MDTMEPSQDLPHKRFSDREFVVIPGLVTGESPANLVLRTLPVHLRLGKQLASKG